MNKESSEIGQLMVMPGDPVHGAYTPINNCSWFAGNLWNSATNDNLIFEQEFNG